MSSPTTASSTTAAGPPAGVSAAATSSHPPVDQSAAKALDDLSNAAGQTGNSIFAQVQAFAEKVQAQAAPYVDNAGVKIDQFIDRVERRASSISGPAGLNGSSTTVGGSTVGEKSVTGETVAAVKDTANVAASQAQTVGAAAGAGAQTVGNTAAANASAVADTISEKAKGLFAAVQQNFEKVTHTIDEKTASGGQPGLVTQFTQAVEKGMQKVDHAFNEPNTATAAGAEPPVQTTTNTVPHEHNQQAAGSSATPVAPVASAVGGASFSGAGLATQ